MDLKALLAKHNGDSSRALAEMSAILDAETAARKAAEAKASGISGKLTLKVGEKGTVSVYGLGRFPVSLYREQWTRLLDAEKTIRAFMEANADKLKVKGAADVAPAATGTDGK